MKPRLFMSCREATHLCSDSHERELSRGERISLKIHLFLCGKCRRFAQQLRQMSNALAGLAQDWRRDDAAPTLSPERREAMKRALRDVQ